MSDFELDLTSRRVIPPDDMGAIGVASDERVRPLRFSMPRFYEGLDLAEFQFRVNYENAGGDDDIYLVDDMEAGEDSITFTWVLSRLATAYEGTVTYVICGIKLADDGETVEQEINSTVATFDVLPGFEVEDASEFAVRLDWLSAIVDPMVEAEAVRVSNEEERVLAEAERVSNEEEREEAEASRRATFADIVATFADAKILVLADGQFDDDGRPTIEGAPGVVYFVPVDASNDEDDGYIEWVLLDGEWERMGTTQANFNAVSASTIDALAADEEVEEGNEVVTQTGLKLLWAKLKATFAALVHHHSASDVTSGTFGSERLGDGSVTSAKLADNSVTESALSAKCVSAGKLADAVSNNLCAIEQKTAGDSLWLVKKYNNGWCEAYYGAQMMNMTLNTPAAGSSAKTVTVPSGIFNATPNFGFIQAVTGRTDAFAYGAIAATLYIQSATKVSFVCNASANISDVWFSIHLVGRWK